METKKVLRLDDLRLEDVATEDPIVVEDVALYACTACQGAPCVCYACQCFVLTKEAERYQPRQ